MSKKRTTRVYVWPGGEWQRAEDYEEVCESWHGDDYVVRDIPEDITDEMVEGYLAREEERKKFEEDAAPYDFDLTRSPEGGLAPEPWAEYEDEDTGHRWAGWLAARGAE